MVAETDVLVIGAGPAGSLVARQLAAAGFAVAIADKKAFPREKPCGEFLSPECQPYLERAGLGGLLAQLGAWPVHGMQLSATGLAARGRFRCLPHRAHGVRGFGVRRTVLDDALLRAAIAAGATLLPRHEFTELVRDGSSGAVAGASLRGPDGSGSRVRARWVVGADGVQSRVARALGLRRPIRWLDQVALTAHFRGVAPRSDADVHLLRGGFFAGTTVDGALYGGNLVVPRRELAARGADGWDEFVQRRLATAPALAARLRSAQRVAPWRGIGPFACTTTAQTVPGAALVGDAAGYVDPLTGEGIYYAMFGACALADALTAALHRPARARTAMARYAAVRRAELAPRLLAARLVQRGLRHPFVVRAAMRALQRWPAVADLLVTLTGDTVHPRELLRPSFWRAFAAST